MPPSLRTEQPLSHVLTLPAAIAGEQDTRLYSWPPRSHWSRAIIFQRPSHSWGETKENCEPLEVPTWEKQEKNDKDHSEKHSSFPPHLKKRIDRYPEL